MATVESPAVARRRVRLALRAARDATKMTQSDVADAMEWSLSKVMRIESGEVTVSPIDLRALLACLGVTGKDTIQDLLVATKAARSRKSWWQDQRYRDLSPSLLRLIQFESEASTVRMFSIAPIPGLLQTADYATAMLQKYGDLAEEGILTDEGIAVRHEVRLRRQREFFGPGRPDLMVMLDESVLYRTIGGPDVMERQLRQLRRLAGEGRTWIRIVPFTAAAPIALFGPFNILELGGEQDAVLYRENFRNDEIVEDSMTVQTHRTSFEKLWGVALSEDESVAAIEKRERELMVSDLGLGRGLSSEALKKRR
jgi:transcriptional regulator with XRE-family HTH domain